MGFSNSSSTSHKRSKSGDKYSSVFADDETGCGDRQLTSGNSGGNVTTIKSFDNKVPEVKSCNGTSKEGVVVDLEDCCQMTLCNTECDHPGNGHEIWWLRKGITQVYLSQYRKFGPGTRPVWKPQLCLITPETHRRMLKAFPQIPPPLCRQLENCSIGSCPWKSRRVIYNSLDVSSTFFRQFVTPFVAEMTCVPFYPTNCDI